ncbi:concanavalin A-like lectin/glucanase [Violaceomyces palustris]|uniref:Concanavalin A-like lectin/glucanase n=1 Tax=Violaceomyces palustris TaxID=1673888 RepID=A0ACD0P0W8_9BASI|nr:concanavalin A-like lectin/glucanase [Violaceomyces palustris]
MSVKCSASSPCPSSSPCCSAEGICGGGAMQCAGGCNPMHSYKATSCLPMPICTSKNITLSPDDYNNSKMFKPILDYSGDPSMAPFTLDSGTLGRGPEGVLLQLKAPIQSKISTTQYILYGTIEATIRHEAIQGLVAAFITMSDIKDEIDWEFTTSDPSDAKTNFFWMGVIDSSNGLDVTPSSSFSVADWHTFTLDWKPDALKWKVDGKTIRTLKASDAGSKYPRSPSRVQFSTWAGGNSTNPEGTIEWAGGPIDWESAEYKQNGYYSQELKQFNVVCADQSVANLETQGSGSTVTSWVYTGSNSSTTGEPEFVLSTDSISFLKNPGKDGISGYPGYDDASTPGTTGKDSNEWDGSGDNNESSSSGSSSSSSGSSFNKQAAIKYGIPIAGAVVALIALWALVVLCIRKRRNTKLSSPQGVGVSKGGAPFGAAAIGAGLGSNKRGASRYEPLNGNEDPTLPFGAERKGTGIGPAVGPSPGGRFREKGSADEYAMGDVSPPRRQKHPDQTPYSDHLPPTSTWSEQRGGYDQRGFQTPNSQYYASPYTGASPHIVMSPYPVPQTSQTQVQYGGVRYEGQQYQYNTPRQYPSNRGYQEPSYGRG